MLQGGWTNLKNILLSEQSRTRRIQTVGFRLCEPSVICKSLAAESRWVVQHWGWVGGPWRVMGAGLHSGVLPALWTWWRWWWHSIAKALRDTDWLT